MKPEQVADEALSLLEKPRVNIKPVTPEELSEIRGEIAEEIEDR